MIHRLRARGTLPVLFLLFIPLLCAAQGNPASAAAKNSARTSSVFIEDLTWPEVRAALDAGKTTAIFYAGSTEQNGPHMATGKHNLVARHVAERIARELGNALVYPFLPFAPTGDAEKKDGHMRFPGSVSLSDATFGDVAAGVAASARAAGFKTVLLMGDHGGGQDALKAVAGRLDGAWAREGVRVFYIGDLYYRSTELAERLLAERGLKDQKLNVGHAGIIDTSELMFVAPRAVRRERIAAGRPNNGVDGDPRQASAVLGKRFIEFKAESAMRQIRGLINASPKP